MEWFDCRSVGVLFGVSHVTVRNWCRNGKLASVRRAGTFDPTRKKRVAKIFISRVDLERFLVDYWGSARRGRRPLSVKSLIELGQESGEITVTVAPDTHDLSSPVRRDRAIQARLALVRKGHLREYNSPASYLTGQMELFPELADRFFTANKDSDENFTTTRQDLSQVGELNCGNAS